MRYLLFLIIFCVVVPVNAKQTKVCIQSHCFSLKTADTEETRAKGLMHKKKLSKKAGMLFVFETQRPSSFWMKDTLIPLDIIWVNESKEIVHIEHNVPPCDLAPCKVYSPNIPAKYVLEINGELSKKYQFSLGDTVAIAY